MLGMRIHNVWGKSQHGLPSAPLYYGPPDFRKMASWAAQDILTLEYCSSGSLHCQRETSLVAHSSLDWSIASLSRSGSVSFSGEIAQRRVSASFLPFLRERMSGVDGRKD